MVFEVALFNAAALAMGTFGIAALAAHQIAITIPSLTFMVPLGIGLAATVRVGLAAGAGDRIAARRAGFTAIAMGAAFMCAAALVLVLWPLQIATLWLPDSAANRDVLALAVTFLHVAAAFQLVDGIQVTASMSLRGLKDAQGRCGLRAHPIGWQARPCACCSASAWTSRALASGWAWPSGSRSRPLP